MATPPENVAGAQPGVVLERGQSIDRFVVIGLVGRGGMGEVYAAYDPELDRKVAIKLLRARGDAGSDGKTRLLREAQAIAKLQHPNVVVVYDVGTFGDSVFIAMEFVEGRTVGGWLHAQARTRQEIMQVYLAAGRGLVAAHAAGLVHRDFKPDNVMVTNDAQVRVMDFGLARQVGDGDGGERAPAGEVGAKMIAAPADQAAAKAALAAAAADIDPDATAKLGPGGRDLSSSGGKYLSLKLTQTGAMLGTPAYMAPEQFAVQPTDARTDQFSFCVALYEALYGARPFEGESFLALMTSVSMGTVSEAPAKARVPAWMRKVLLRGLQTDPDRRYPSMAALLGALEKDPTVRPRRIALGVVVAACAVLGAVGARRAVGTQHALCRGGGERFAGTWEPGGVPSPRKEAIHKAFLATGKGYAEQAFAGASRFLDDYVGRWTAIYADACEATHARGEQSAEVLDLRMACLQERLGSVKALTNVLASADPTTVENAVSAAAALPRLDRCSDVGLLRAVIKPPDDEASRRKVQALRTEAARLGALVDSGHCAEGEALAQKLMPEARAVGYGPLVADVFALASFRTNLCIPVAQAVERYREAFSAALASHHDEAAAEAAVQLSSYLSSLDGGQPEAGRQWADVARALIKRIGGHPLLETWMLGTAGGLLMNARKWDEARATFETASAASVKLHGPDHPDVFISQTNIALALELAGRYEESLAVNAKARAGMAKLLGPDHPRLAFQLNNEAEVLNLLGRWSEARVAYERTVEIWRRTGADPSFISFALTGEGVAYVGERRFAEAIPILEEALRIREDRKMRPEDLGATRFALARALWSRPSSRARALALARQARDDYAKVVSPTAPVPDIEGWLRVPG
jgi:serine/threonine protein kinase/tetratricopeptide (TPR) repeat protein